MILRGVFCERERIMEEKEVIRISVRSLVEFILRQGDIDNRKSGSVEREAMLMGGRIHRKIQNRMGSDYKAEVSLKELIDFENFKILIEGRADGVIENKNGVTIDEIKGVLKSLDQIDEPVPVHLAQAKCYAYIYAKQNDLTTISVQLTYCQMETEEIKRFVVPCQIAELSRWFENLIKQYRKWAEFEYEWKKTRNASAREIVFPFEYRSGQKNIAASVYHTILQKKKLFVQAPTGVGKTMAAVFPAVKALGEEIGDKIFYLTARTITRTVAEEAFHTLKEQALKMKVITLTATDKICFCEETNCRPDLCPYAKGHFDRVNDAVYDLLVSKDEWTRDVLKEQAEKYQVCPFEMALDASVWADAVICDYNYVFDPNAHLKRFFSEGAGGDYIFLIDEAHNLVDRAREMYSATLCKEDVLEMKRLVRGDSPKLEKYLDECNRQLLALKRECENVMILESVSHIVIKLINILSALEDYMDNVPEKKREQVLDFYFKVRDFVNIHDIHDDNYITYAELDGEGRFMIRLFCVNPALNLKAYLDQGRAAVYFSATLLPVQYYKKLLSTQTDDYAIYAESPFPKENRLILNGIDVSTKYTLRGEAMYRRIADYIVKTVSAKKGNYMVFFPSYRMLEDVSERLKEKTEFYERTDVIYQEQYMTEEDRENFLVEFEKERTDSLVGLCVMGGIFSEGIDLSKDRLIGAIVVGTGLPLVCTQRELLRKYFDGEDRMGFAYAYLYPGMNKVLQSAGRVIRTEEDKGVIVLLDGRFADTGYRNIFPREWEGVKSCTLENAGEYLEAFWNKEE